MSKGVCQFVKMASYQILQARCSPGTARFIVVLKCLKEIRVCLLVFTLPQMHFTSTFCNIVTVFCKDEYTKHGRGYK